MVSSQLPGLNKRNLSTNPLANSKTSKIISKTLIILSHSLMVKMPHLRERGDLFYIQETLDEL